MKKICIVSLCLLFILGILCHKTFIRFYQAFQLNKTSIEKVKYYTLNEGVQIQDITQQLIFDKTVPKELKEELTNGTRRIIVFKYFKWFRLCGWIFQLYYRKCSPGNHYSSRRE